MTIKLNNNIYKKDLIKQAIKDFQELAQIKSKQEGDYTEVSFEKIEPEYQDILGDEFGNYLLGLHS